MRNYSSPTESAAIGSIDKEFNRLRRLALKIKNHQLSPAREAEARKQFTGIFRHVLENVMNEEHPA